MKLKVAILDNDINYLDRLTSTFNSKYADKLEVYSFTEKEKVIETLKKVRMDVLGGISDESAPAAEMHP